jgi:hypothetical protein
MFTHEDLVTVGKRLAPDHGPFSVNGTQPGPDGEDKVVEGLRFEDGHVPTEAEIVAALAAANLEEAQQAIDLAAGRARARYASRGEHVAAEYEQAEAAAKVYQAAGYAGEAPAAVHAWAEATGMTAQAAAENILATASAWRAKLDEIRRIRLVGKAAVTAAADPAAALAEVLAKLAAV